MNSNIIKTINYIKRNGIIKGYYAIKERLEDNKAPIYVYAPISEEERLNQISDAINIKTSFSILVPAYETKEEYITALIDSVRAQTYSNWELVIADASASNVVKKVVDKYSDNRIVYIKLESNGGISLNSNEGLKYCSKEYIGLLDHDDLLTNDALYSMGKAIDASKENGIDLQMLYSDEDKTNSENTAYFDVNIKEKFNYDLIMSNNYICHFLVMKANLMKELTFRSEFDGAQDHDIILRAVTNIKGRFKDDYKKYIAHIDKVLYHWRCHEASTAANPKSKEYAYEAGKRAVESFLKAEGIRGNVLNQPHMGFFYVDYEPDIFLGRKKVAAIGGRVVDKKGYVIDGVYDDDLAVMFKGMNKNYSGGKFHHMACQMEVPYLNTSYMISTATVKLKYKEFMKNRTDKAPLLIDKEFCDMLKDEGYVFVYDPKVIIKEND